MKSRFNSFSKRNQEDDALTFSFSILWKRRGNYTLEPISSTLPPLQRKERKSSQKNSWLRGQDCVVFSRLVHGFLNRMGENPFLWLDWSYVSCFETFGDSISGHIASRSTSLIADILQVRNYLGEEGRWILRWGNRCSNPVTMAVILPCREMVSVPLASD